MTALLQASNLHLSYGEQQILRGVDLAVHAGEVVVLVGPNGAGKSSLLALMSGDISPDHGQIHLNQKNIAISSAKELARQRATLLQEVRVAFPFSVAEVVRMGRAPWRDTDESEHDDQVVATALAIADVSHLVERRYPSLSGGEKARASFARVLAQEPSVLMLDEPTAALDIGHQERVLQQARRCAGAGDAVLVVLHDLTLAAAYADTVVLLNDGQVVDQGPPAQVFQASVLTEVYNYPIEVFAHPNSADILVVPRRNYQQLATNHVEE